jgi:hypothetical protein
MLVLTDTRVIGAELRVRTSQINPCPPPTKDYLLLRLVDRLFSVEEYVATKATDCTELNTYKNKELPLNLWAMHPILRESEEKRGALPESQTKRGVGTSEASPRLGSHSAFHPRVPTPPRPLRSRCKRWHRSTEVSLYGLCPGSGLRSWQCTTLRVAACHAALPSF